MYQLVVWSPEKTGLTLELSPELGMKKQCGVAMAQEGSGEVGIARGEAGVALWSLKCALEAKEEEWETWKF